MDETRSEKMKVKLKKTLQTVMLVTLLLYSSLLVYQILSYGLTQASQIPSDPKDYDLLDLRSRGQYSRESRTKRVLTNTVNSVTSDISPAVTATRKPPLTTLDDLFISVKTTQRFHNIRLPIILQTWFQLAKNQTWFFTDTDDKDLKQKTNGHVINTSCSPTHSRKALCCKMSVELDTFLDSDKDWFCHFDDDNYVNVPRLVRFLSDYNSQEDWYFGKTSVPSPVQIAKRKISFWFATGGAGFCLSRSLTLKMMPFASQGKFIRMCEKVLFPDDVTMGYIIEHLLKKPLTVVDQFHSHLEPMKFLRRDQLHEQISFSYQVVDKDDWVNVLKIDGFSRKYDPSRFLSLHCFLFPYFSFCPK